MNPTYQVITDKIVATLESGVVPWQKPWSGGMPKNMVSGRHYSGVNVWSLHAQPFGSPHWVSFKQALDLGGHVRKGETGTQICFTKDLPVKMVEVENDDGETITMADGRTGRRMLKYSTVFNLEQCEGIADPEPITMENHDPIPAAQSIIDGFHGPKIIHGGGRACYTPSADLVNMPEIGRFVSPEAYYGTAFHELAHSTGHASRLNRGLADGFGSVGYGKEELIAEMASSYLCGHVGIESATVENSAAYIQSWINTIKSDAKLVISSAAAAQRAANFILQNGADCAA